MNAPSPMPEDRPDTRVTSVRIPVTADSLAGELAIPAGARGLVLFAHGSGSSRHSPRNRFVARAIREAGLATLLFDLLTAAEEAEDASTRRLRFDIKLLTTRLIQVTHWIGRQRSAHGLGIGYFGASTGAAAALAAAAELGPLIQAVVSRGGRPDLADDALPRVRAATLLIVGEWDDGVLDLNRSALARLECKKRLTLVPRATHLFEEPGTLDQVAALAAAWFRHFLQPT